MTTSGVVDTVSFDARKVIDRAFRACRIDPQMISGEMLSNAKDSLNLMLSSLPHSVTSAWTRESILLPVPMNQTAITLPAATQRVLSASYRSMTRLTGAVTASDAVVSSTILDGSYATYVQQATGGGWMMVNFGSAQTVNTIGIATPADITGTINIKTSADGIAFTQRATLTDFKAFVFNWVDLDPSIDTQYLRIEGANNLVLSIAELFIGSAYAELPLQAVSQDQFNSLVSQASRSNRPVMFYQQRTAAGPILNIWPQVTQDGTFGLLSVVRDRAPEDVVDLTDALEVPRIWNEAVIMGLAYRIALDDPKVDFSVIQMLKPMAEEYRRAAMLADGDNTGWQMSWNLRGYS
jgi:hypothetical protein